MFKRKGKGPTEEQIANYIEAVTKKEEHKKKPIRAVRYQKPEEFYDSHRKEAEWRERERKRLMQQHAREALKEDERKGYKEVKPKKPSKSERGNH